MKPSTRRVLDRVKCPGACLASASDHVKSLVTHNISWKHISLSVDLSLFHSTSLLYLTISPTLLVANYLSLTVHLSLYLSHLYLSHCIAAIVALAVSLSLCVCPIVLVTISLTVSHAGLLECGCTTLHRLNKDATATTTTSSLRGSSTRRRQPALSGKPSRAILNAVSSMACRLVDDEIAQLLGAEAPEFELPAEALSAFKNLPTARLMLSHYMLQCISDRVNSAAISTISSFVVSILALPDSEDEDEVALEVAVGAEVEVGMLLHSIGKLLVDLVEKSNEFLHGKHAMVRDVLVEEFLVPLAPDQIEAHLAAVHLLSCVPVVNAMGDVQFGESLQTIVSMGCRTGPERPRLRRMYELLAEKHHDRLQGNPTLQCLVDQINDELLKEDE